MYLCQQLQSFHPGDAFQFHPIRSFSIQGCQRIGTGRTDGLLSPILPAPQEAPLFGGIGRYAVPMPEPGARRHNIKFLKVQWSHHSEDEATWEREDRLRLEYPAFFAEEPKSQDEILLSGGELSHPS